MLELENWNLGFRYYLLGLFEKSLCLYINTEVNPIIWLLRRKDLCRMLGQLYTYKSLLREWSLEEVLNRVVSQRGMVKYATVANSSNEKFVQFEFSDTFHTSSIWLKLQSLFLFGPIALRPYVTIDFPIFQGYRDRNFKKKLELLLQREGFVSKLTRSTGNLLPYFYKKEGRLKILKVQCLMFPERAINFSLVLFSELLKVDPIDSYQVTLFDE